MAKRTPVLAEREVPPLPLSRAAIIVGLLLIVGFTVAGSYSCFLRYELIGTGYLPRGAIAAFMLLILFNVLLRRFSPRLALSGRAMLLIFVMLMVMAAIPGQEYGQHWYLNTLGIVYYATPDFARPELYLNDLNPLLVPSTDPGANVVLWAFEGLPGGRAVPMREWITPLVVWTPFFAAVYWTIIGFAGIMSPRWEEQEKLLFPLTQVPVELAESERGELSPLFKSPLMWICFAISASLYVVKGLHTYWPTVPDIPLQKDSGIVAPGGPWAAFNRTPLHVYPEMIGISYLLTSEVGFSLWFFYILRQFQEFGRIAAGITTGHGEFFEFQTIGGYLMLAAALLWSARHYLAEFARAAWVGGRRAPLSAHEQPYRTALYGFLIGLAVIWVWCSWVGMSLLWAVILWGVFPFVSMIVSRVICEAGMFIYSSPFRWNDAVFRMFNARVIGPRNVTLMTMTSWCQIRSTATQNMPVIFQGFKIGSVTRMSRPALMWVMFASICVAILTIHYFAPHVIYHWSVPKLGWWPSGSSRNTTRHLVRFLENPYEMRVGDWAAIGWGAAFTAFLFAMRIRFLWWPFHPLGFIAWLGWPIDRYWFSILIGWLAKVCVVRFVGFKAFSNY
ncbi:MAG: DUF6785 family protein, partial [Armatimonadota bacterium]